MTQRITLIQRLNPLNKIQTNEPVVKQRNRIKEERRTQLPLRRHNRLALIFF